MIKQETNRERVLECIRHHPEGIDDDQVSEKADVKPRQQVYQIANRLAAEGLIDRLSVVKPGKRRKIHNFPANSDNLSAEKMEGRDGHEIPRWKKRLAALVAATGKNEAEILDEALEGFAHDLLKDIFK